MRKTTIEKTLHHRWFVHKHTAIGNISILRWNSIRLRRIAFIGTFTARLDISSAMFRRPLHFCHGSAASYTFAHLQSEYRARHQKIVLIERTALSRNVTQVKLTQHSAEYSPVAATTCSIMPTPCSRWRPQAACTGGYSKSSTASTFQLLSQQHGKQHRFVQLKWCTTGSRHYFISGEPPVVPATKSKRYIFTR